MGRGRSLEGQFLESGSPGDVMYSDKKDKDLKAYAVYHGRKITTSRLRAISNSDDIVRRITEIVIVE